MNSKDTGASNTFDYALSGVDGAMGNRIVPPGPERDRSGPERERYRERQRERLKGKAGDVISKVPIVTKGGKIKVPTTGGYEPTWRPGRDGQGGPGKGPGPGEPGSDPGEVYEMTPEEFAAWVLEDLDLPNLLKKQLATTVVKSLKVKGISHNGPKARLNKRATGKARIRRTAALRNAQPELFVEGFAEKCQVVFDAYLLFSYLSISNADSVDKLRQIFGSEIEGLLEQIETIDPYPKLYDESLSQFREQVRLAVQAYIDANEGSAAPYTVHNEMRQRIETFVYEKVRAGQLLPTIEEVPFHKADLRFNRLQEKFDPDSKAVVFLLLDRSGSMDGDPIRLCKLYFFLCVLFLRTRYKNVEIVLISHDAQDYLWKNEEEFFNIGAGGGTVVAPALKLVFNIAETGATCAATKNSAGPFPASVYNRFMFHGTDGDLFDGDRVIRELWEKILIEANFNYCGYLEVGTSWGGFGSSWRLGGQALKGLPAEAKERLGMARANRTEDVIKAFKEILTKNANDGGA